MNADVILRWARAALLLPAFFIGCANPGKGPSGGPPATVERLEVVDRKPAYGGTRFGEVGE
jgi:hypothetical protein